MAKKHEHSQLLPNNTIIEVIAKDKEGNYYKKEMTMAEWSLHHKKKGFQYTPYQKGFSQFKIVQIKK